MSWTWLLQPVIGPCMVNGILAEREREAVPVHGNTASGGSVKEPRAAEQVII